jgi:uncharacterized protein (TIGR03086 family)
MPGADDRADLSESPGPAARFRQFAAMFTERVDAVPDDAWDNPAPVEGWVARDVVGHLVTWIPALFFDSAGIDTSTIPAVEQDPAGAWHRFRDLVQAALDDPAVADAPFESPMGRSTWAATFDQIATSDVFLHTWDLARATGLDETLDPDEVQRLYAGMEPMDEVLRQSGHYGPRVPVPDDADPQTKLLAFIGRQP